MTKTLYLSLGSNLGDRHNFLQEAIARLSQAIAPVSAVSSFIETAPWGFDSPHPFLNAAVAIPTDLSPEKVLEITQKVERDMGRNYKRSFGEAYRDRVIDIDILMIDDLVYRSTFLQIPHPHMCERDFVLVPLGEIAADISYPFTGVKIYQILKNLR